MLCAEWPKTSCIGKRKKGEKEGKRREKEKRKKEEKSKKENKRRKKKKERGGRVGEAIRILKKWGSIF